MAVRYQSMLTTIDNPFNPFDDYLNWHLFDVEKGYDCAGRVARIANTSNANSDYENDVEIERAIDEIVMNDPLDIYIKVQKELTPIE